MALSGHRLLVAADTWLPYVNFPQEAEDDVSLASGAAFDAFQIIAAKLNFSFALVRSVDRTWGAYLGNGSFTGMIGMALRGEVDMALGPFLQSYERQLWIDFSEVLITDSLSIFLPRPDITKDLSNFLKPFSLTTWLVLLFSVAFSTALAFLFHSTENKIEQLRLFASNYSDAHLTKREKADNLKLFGTDWIIRIVCQEATATQIKYLASHVLLGTWLVAGVVLSTAYCGFLTSMLTVPRIRIPVDSLEDLLRSDLAFATEVGSAMNEMIATAKSGPMQEAAERMLVVNSCYSSRYDVKAGRLAVLCDVISMLQAMSEEFSVNATCSYYVARERMAANSASMIFPKNSFYKPYFDEEIRHMIAGGMIKRLINSYSPNSTACLVSPGSEPGRRHIFVYTLEDLGGVFILLLTGFGLGVMALIVESTSHKWQQRSSSQEPSIRVPDLY